MNPPGPKGLPLLGVLPDLWRDPFGFLRKTVREYGPVARIPAGPDAFFLLSHPDYYQYVLQHPQKFTKQTRVYHFLRPLLGTGLLTSEGGFWLRQRRIAQPAFHRQRISAFSELMVRLTLDMLEEWRAIAASGEILDLTLEMTQLTYRIVSQSLFSTPAGDQGKLIGQALREFLQDVEERAHRVFSIPLSVPTPRNLRVKKALRVIKQAGMDLIMERRKSSETFPDLLSMLMEAKDEETGEGMNDAQLLDEVVTLLMAGHETTANALCWTWYLLAEHPEAEEKLNRELRDVLPGRPPGLQDLAQLSYTERVIEESLRLYPPVWWLDRRVMEEVEIGGYRIPRGSIVVISPFVMHRHPDYWENPERFDPDRFSPERSAGRHPFSYLPFSLGPRQCIGNNFAMMEARLILATIAQRYRIHLAPGQKVEMDPSIVLRPKDGLKAVLIPA